MPALSPHATQPPPFTVAALTLGTTATVTPEGEIDMATADRLGAAIEQAIRARPETLVIDLGAVTFMDTSGAHLLVAARRRADTEGVRLVVVGARPSTSRLIALCGISDVIPLAPPAATVMA